VQRKFILFIVLVYIIYNQIIRAQEDCKWQPAPCPNTTSINETMDVIKRTKNNDVFPQEISMENNLRNILISEVQNVAKENRWSMYELNEEGLSGPPYIFISYNDWEATPFNKRPPHQYQIGFIFIINKDSLQAWRNWLLNDIRKQGSQLVQQYNQTQANPLLEQYQDSINHYTQLYTNFIQSNNAAYIKDIQNHNQNGINNYQHKQKILLDKIDSFQKEIQNVQQEGNSSFDTFNDEVNHKTVTYAENSIAVIHFYINPYHADFALENGSQVNILPQNSINIPHAFYAGITTNNAKADRHNYELNYHGFVFNDPSCIGTILFGSYLPKDNYNYYPAAFSKNFGNKHGVIGKVKEITCDKVQNILVHVEGSNSNVNKIIAKINWEKLYALLNR
jgi:hypothetical protein